MVLLAGLENPDGKHVFVVLVVGTEPTYINLLLTLSGELFLGTDPLSGTRRLRGDDSIEGPNELSKVLGSDQKLSYSYPLAVIFEPLMYWESWPD